MTTAFWQTICDNAREEAGREPMLGSFLHLTVLRHHNLADAVSYLLADKLGSHTLPALCLQEVFASAFAADDAIVTALQRDLEAIQARDPVCQSALQALLFYKGFHTLAAWRAAHWLWQQQRRALAWFLQSRISARFAVDIHPAAGIGSGVLLDHATGIVVGETATIADDVSILQNVTLGGTGKESGDRHPKIGAGVLIGPGSKIFGNINIGQCAQLAAGSVVIKPVADCTLVAGVPARRISQVDCAKPALEMRQTLT